jgi:hypothetical protein
MNSEDIFKAALEVICLVQKHTKHVPTAMRIMNAAKQGFTPDLDFQFPASIPEHPHEDSLSPQESRVESR